MDTKPKKKADILDSEEEVVFTSLRATSWDEFCGQATVKKSLQIAISAAQNRSEAIEHVLLYGPPGLGKTSLSHLIAREMDSNIRMTSGPAIVRVGDLAAILTNLEKGDVLFIDEIHRLNTAVEETLYSAMEDYALDVIMGKGPSARTLRLDLPQFTVIGATTRVGMLSAPLRDRFGVIHHLTFYSPQELSIIIKKAAKKLTIEIDEDAIGELAKRARGTPRIALRLLKRARDYASVHKKESVDRDVVIDALDLIEVDPLGLDQIDRYYLNAIINKHSGGPVGVETIAASISEDVETIEEVVEPYLMQVGFIKRTPRGRIATDAAYHHLGIDLPKERTSGK
ncbi:MAG: Holliday junction branch migration DNA helicase RuvB [Candidatus Levybacteria bacterium]|nr:Holliday junction branch migration DNA helicase RuvB [Candidatus Levybacteria bacterium]